MMKKPWVLIRLVVFWSFQVALI